MPSSSSVVPQVRTIDDVAADLGLTRGDLHPYGRDVAKVDLSVLSRERRRSEPPRLILVSAITPTPAGEGKTTTSIGLADAFRLLDKSVCVALREPSMGPCFGVKGGGTGGGRSQLVPSDRINLHFTGDFHAVTSAHNLLAALLDNHIFFDLCLANDADDLRARLDRRLPGGIDRRHPAHARSAAPAAGGKDRSAQGRHRRYGVTGYTLRSVTSDSAFRVAACPTRRDIS